MVEPKFSKGMKEDAKHRLGMNKRIMSWEDAGEGDLTLVDGDWNEVDSISIDGLLEDWLRCQIERDEVILGKRKIRSLV